jgi:hypothetical protein
MLQMVVVRIKQIANEGFAKLFKPPKMRGMALKIQFNSYK